MRFLLLPVVTVVSLAACGSARNIDPKAEADAPAVIDTRPKPAAPGPNATAASPNKGVIPDEPLKRTMTVGQGYALVTATMVNHDAVMLSQLYDPDATLTVPDSTFTPRNAVVRELIGMAQSKSLSEFQRTSLGTRIVDDSTLADSGSYLMVLKRSAKDSVIERGTYAAQWRARKDVTQWVILRDQITPAKGAGAKKGRR